MSEHKLVPVKIDWAMWQAAKPHLEAMVAQGGANATHFSDAFEDACKAATTNPPEISSTSVGVSREEHETMRRALLATAPVVPQTDLRALVGEMRGYVGPDPDNTIEGWCDELEALIERMEG